MSALHLTDTVARSLLEHADGESPLECCGLLAGRDDSVDRSYPLTNASEWPERRYFAEPGELIAAFRSIREEGRKLLGIYHSHPFSSPTPSTVDIREAHYPHCIYVIIAPAGWSPRLHGFRLDGGKVSRVSLTIHGA